MLNEAFIIEPFTLHLHFEYISDVLCFELQANLKVNTLRTIYSTRLFTLNWPLCALICWIRFNYTKASFIHIFCGFLACKKLKKCMWFYVSWSLCVFLQVYFLSYIFNMRFFLVFFMSYKEPYVEHTAFCKKWQGPPQKAAKVKKTAEI